MPMTCYFRHLNEVFKKAGIEPTSENKNQLDRVIHSLVEAKYKDCTTTWREVKKRITVDEDEFVQHLKSAWNELNLEKA